MKSIIVIIFCITKYNLTMDNFIPFNWQLTPYIKFISLEDKDIEENMIGENIVNFVKNSTLHFDKSHGYEHAFIVTQMAIEITLASNLEVDITLILAAMVHDVVDHKYLDQSISKDQLCDFLVQGWSQEICDQVINIIDNISWSKQMKGVCTMQSKLQQYVHIIRDADRIEAIGSKGLNRCYEYTKVKNPDMTHEMLVKEVVKHCNEKLVHLYDGFYTDYAKESAIHLHNEILTFLSNPNAHVF